MDTQIRAKVARRVLVSSLLSSLLLLSGCQTPPTQEEIQQAISGFTLPHIQANNRRGAATQPAPAEASATIYIIRPSYRAGLVSLNVYRNQKSDINWLGETYGKEYIYFNLPPGQHTLLSQGENLASLKLQVMADDVIFIEQDVSLGLFSAKNQLRRLADDKGTYFVKQFSQGVMRNGF